MVNELKRQLVALLKNLGYNVSDGGQYEEHFPWLVVRTSGHNRTDAYDIRMDQISLTIDIFSNYSGEKEILEIVEDIGNNIQRIKIENEKVLNIVQHQCRILGDKATGPVRKHGVITYTFSLAIGREGEI